MTKVCRLCLSKLQRGSKYFNINAVESFTGFMPYRDQLTTCIPEMALDLIPNPVICNGCRTALKAAYAFKTQCLLVEKKIREYVEAQPSNVTVYDLSLIDTSDLRIYKPEIPIIQQPEPEPEPPRVESKLSELLQVKKGGPAPPKMDFLASLDLSINNILESNSLSCSPCKMTFTSAADLQIHKQQIHNEEYSCNFCNMSFRTLQNLRRHNNICMRASTGYVEPSVLTKRPHLPTKAKNHLKRWLFRHTDHPYPTDLEKQQLMQETGLSLLQVENWFINARRRILGDLTKLKNSYGRRRRRPPQPVQNLEDELIEPEPERLLEESFLLEDEALITEDPLATSAENVVRMIRKPKTTRRSNNKTANWEPSSDDNEELPLDPLESTGSMTKRAKIKQEMNEAPEADEMLTLHGLLTSESTVSLAKLTENIKREADKHSLNSLSQNHKETNESDEDNEEYEDEKSEEDEAAAGKYEDLDVKPISIIKTEIEAEDR